MDHSPLGSCPRDSPGKNTAVVYHGLQHIITINILIFNTHIRIHTHSDILVYANTLRYRQIGKYTELTRAQCQKITLLHIPTYHCLASSLCTWETISLALRIPPGGMSGKEPACQFRRPRDAGSVLGLEDPLEQGMAPHSNILVWRIPWTDEPRVKHNCCDLARTHWLHHF